MLKHLRLKHNTGIEHENTPQKQPSLAEFVRSPRSRHLSGTKAEEITRAIVNMVVQDYMPLRIVEGSGFKNLMSLIAPEYSVPSRNTIKARTDKVYDEEKSKLPVELRDVATVALTTDTWTSNSTASYITVTEHHIDKNWEMKSNVPLTREMPERHTGDNLAEKIKSCCFYPRFSLRRLHKLI